MIDGNRLYRDPLAYHIPAQYRRFRLVAQLALFVANQKASTRGVQHGRDRFGDDYARNFFHIHEALSIVVCGF